jgi:hypothetical protein
MIPNGGRIVETAEVMMVAATAPKPPPARPQLRKDRAMARYIR